MNPIAWLLNIVSYPGKLKRLQADYGSQTKTLSKALVDVNLYKGQVRQGQIDKQAILDLHLEEKKRLVVELENLQQWVLRYQQLWKSGLAVPDIKDALAYHQVYNPWGDISLKGYSLDIHDLEYYSYSLAQWRDHILPRISAEVRDQLPRWIAEISDCDNFAETMCAALALAFIAAGKKRQGAFGYAEGKSGAGAHAYNFFVTKSEGIFIYEPQDGSIRGRLGETVEPYIPYTLEFRG